MRILPGKRREVFFESVTEALRSLGLLRLIRTAPEACGPLRWRGRAVVALGEYAGRLGAVRPLDLKPIAAILATREAGYPEAGRAGHYAAEAEISPTRSVRERSP